MDGPSYQPMFDFRFIRLPAQGEFPPAPVDHEAMCRAIEKLNKVCDQLSKASKAGRLGPILKVEGGIIVGELAGYVAVGPDTGGIVAAPGILKPA